MSRSSDADAEEMILWPPGIGVGSPPIDLTMCAGRRIPPLAIAEYAVAIWRGVTDSPCPIGRLPIDEPEYCCQCNTIPRASPGRSTPVGEPNPNRWTQESNRWGPSFIPISSAPMLLENLRM